MNSQHASLVFIKGIHIKKRSLYVLHKLHMCLQRCASHCACITPQSVWITPLFFSLLSHTPLQVSGSHFSFTFSMIKPFPHIVLRFISVYQSTPHPPPFLILSLKFNTLGTNSSSSCSSDTHGAENIPIPRANAAAVARRTIKNCCFQTLHIAPTEALDVAQLTTTALVVAITATEPLARTLNLSKFYMNIPG